MAIKVIIFQSRKPSRTRLTVLRTDYVLIAFVIALFLFKPSSKKFPGLQRRLAPNSCACYVITGTSEWLTMRKEKKIYVNGIEMNFDINPQEEDDSGQPILTAEFPSDI